MEDYEISQKELIEQRSFFGSAESKTEKMYKTQLEMFVERFKMLVSMASVPKEDVIYKFLEKIPDNVLIKRNADFSAIALIFIVGKYENSAKGLNFFKTNNKSLLGMCGVVGDIEIVRYVRFYNRIISQL